LPSYYLIHTFTLEFISMLWIMSPERSWVVKTGDLSDSQATDLQRAIKLFRDVRRVLPTEPSSPATGELIITRETAEAAVGELGWEDSLFKDRFRQVRGSIEPNRFKFADSLIHTHPQSVSDWETGRRTPGTYVLISIGVIYNLPTQITLGLIGLSGNLNRKNRT
jgi:hypothetical protein